MECTNISRKYIHDAAVSARQQFADIYLVGCNLAVVLTKGFKMIWQLEQPVCYGGENSITCDLGKLLIGDVNVR